MKSSCVAVVAEIRARLVDRSTPLIVALDGASGSGKTTLAALISRELAAVVVPSDDFYAAQIPDTEWERRSPEERASAAIDWRRLRAEALEPLLSGKAARWRSFDFDSGVRSDGTYAMRTDTTAREPSQVIVLDGAYSTRPELADLVNLAILVDAPLQLRHARLAAREASDFLASWHKRWDAAEAYYFSQVRPPSSFDLIVTPESL